MISNDFQVETQDAFIKITFDESVLKKYATSEVFLFIRTTLNGGNWFFNLRPLRAWTIARFKSLNGIYTVYYFGPWQYVREH